MNIANILTLIRLLLVPIFAVFFIQGNYLLAIVVFVLCGITDFVDGFIARKYDMVTEFGKLMDPLADKVLQITALVLLTIYFQINIAIVIVFALKEAVMLTGSTFLYRKKVVVFSNWYGKVATVVLFIAIFGQMFVQWYEKQPNPDKVLVGQMSYAANITIWAALGITLLAFVGYLYQFIMIVRGCKKI
ncbi:MAG: CDP-alcohol phosphatidyltransferase family protein [Bacillota bacterium]